MGWLGSVALARAELEVVLVSKWLFWTSLRFVHTSSRAPKYVRFSMWNADETIAALTRLGYPIDSAR